MAHIAVNPAQLRNAAKGLSDEVAPDLKTQAQRLEGSYRISPPGFGTVLSILEAEYNSTISYHLQNLKVANESVTAVANGLLTTATAYDRAEQVNVDMTAGAGVANPDGYGSGWTDTGIARTFYQPLDGDGLGWGDVDQLVAVGTQLAAVALSVSTACLAPGYLPAPITAALLVADGFSIVATSRDLSAISATLESVAKEFDTYANGATAGWEDMSVVQYRKVVTEIGRELSQMTKALSAASTMLTAVAALIGAFWLAFIAFTLPFFVTILELTLYSIGPQAAVLQPIIQGLSTLAGQAWLTASGTVITVCIATGTLILGVVKEWSNFQRFDEQGDSTPDLKQVKIEWHSA